MKKLFLFSFTLLLLSCSPKIPRQTLNLTEAINKEGERMHNLNIQLLNTIFSEKRSNIDLFIKEKYTPAYISNLKKLAEAKVKKEGTTLDWSKEFPKALEASIPIINARRDKMQSSLEEQRVKLVTKLNLDYKNYVEASTSLTNLIESAIAKEEAKQRFAQKIAALTNNKIDLNKVEDALDDFVSKGADFTKKIESTINNFNTTINSLTK